MDYLVFGVGFGSTLVLLGWVLRQFGPSLRYRDTPDEVLGAEQLLERNDWQRFCIAMGALLSVCGAVMLLVTLITLLIRPADRTGSIIVGSIFVISLLAVAAWIVMYVNQHRALAGDRRAEVVASSRERTPARPRPASETPITAAPTRVASRPSAPKNVAATAIDDERGRKSTPQPQRQATESGNADTDPGSVSAGQTESLSEWPASPEQESAESGVQPASTAESAIRNTPTTTTPAPDATQALRNLHFKRAGASRREEAGSISETTAEKRNEVSRNPAPEDPTPES